MLVLFSYNSNFHLSNFKANVGTGGQETYDPRTRLLTKDDKRL